jgi:hypothetical protein
MFRRLLLLLALLLGFSVTGCQWLGSGDPYFDTLWRQGHGFNNPNPLRIKQGLPPKDF